jgi:hypothetical protein
LLVSLRGDELRALRRLTAVCGAFEAARIAYPSIQYSEFPYPEYRRRNELLKPAVPLTNKLQLLLKGYTARERMCLGGLLISVVWGGKHR